MKDIHPDTFEELSAVSAILRPGPLRMGMDKEFGMRKRGLTFIRNEKGELMKDDRQTLVQNGKTVENPGFKKEMTRPWAVTETPDCLQKILGPTKGLVVYQEQFMLVAMKFGMSNKEVNAFRKALVKYEKSAANELKRIQRVESYHRDFLIGGSKFDNYGKDIFKTGIEDASHKVIFAARPATEDDISLYNKLYDKYLIQKVDDLLAVKPMKTVSTDVQLETALNEALQRTENIWQLIRAFAAYGFNKSISSEETVQDKIRGTLTLKQVDDLVKAGEEVEIRSSDKNGSEIWVEVKDVHDHGVLDLVEVELEDGKKIKCTLDHKFRTSEGMIPLKEIIERGLEIWTTN